MTITALPTPPTRSDPANFAARGDALLAALPTFVAEANALAADVSARQDDVTTKTTTTTTKAAEALASQTAAGDSQTAAEAAKVVALAQASAATLAAATSTAKAIESTNSATASEAARAAAVIAQNNAVAVVSGGTASLVAAPAKMPMANANGMLDASWLTAISGVRINHIGTPGMAGFGVGICPAVPAGYTPLPGCTDVLSDNYGNYQYTDGSVMVWVPAFWLRIGHAANPTYGAYGVNSEHVLPLTAYPDEATANAEGFWLHRAFKNAGATQLGFFRDKYDCSQNGTVASSIKNAMPMVSGPSSEAATATVAAKAYTILSVGTTDFTLIGAASNTVGHRFTATGAGAGTGTVSQQIGFVGCTANGQAPANAYYGAIAAAKSRGNKFFVATVFISDALARIATAHAQASTSTSTTACAWWSSTTTNYPKGNNNNALRDGNDTGVIFTTAGASSQPNMALAGSGVPFAKTTHNGQACGVADVNGNIYKIALGVTSIVTTKAITAATQTNPVTLTVAAHGYTTGQVKQVTSVGGMTQINDRFYTVTVVDANTISLDGVDGTAFAAYTSGGSVRTGDFYTLKPSVDMAAVTAGASLATDHWGATGVAAQFDAITPNFATTYPNNGNSQRFGNGTNAVFDMSTANGRALAFAGLPAAGGMSTSGTTAMGQDECYQYIQDQLCVLVSAYWGNGSNAGVRVRSLSTARYSAYNPVGFSSASYL